MARQIRQTRGKKGPRKTRKQGKRKGGKTRKRVMGKRRKRTMRKVRRGGMVLNPFVRTKKQRMEKLVTQFEKLKQRVISGHESATAILDKISSGVEYDDNIRTHIAEFVNCRDVYDHLHNGRKYKTFKDLVTKEDNVPPELKTLCKTVIDLKSEVDEEMDYFSQVAVAIENSSPLIDTPLFERRSYFKPTNKDVLSKAVPPEVAPPKVAPPKAPPEVDPPPTRAKTDGEVLEKLKKDFGNMETKVNKKYHDFVQIDLPKPKEVSPGEDNHIETGSQGPQEQQRNKRNAFGLLEHRGANYLSEP